MFVCLLGALGCSGGGGGGGDPLSLALVPASGPPGTLVRVEGLDAAAHPPTRLAVTIGGQLAPAVLDRAGRVHVAVPLFLGAAGWPAPPAGPVDVVVKDGDETLATLAGAFTVTSLAPAPGTTAALAADVAAIAGDLTAVVEGLGGPVGLDAQYLDAFLGAARELASGTGPESLPALLARLAAEPEALALVDALHASSGAAGQVAALRGLVEQLRSQVPGVPPAGLVGPLAAAPTEVSDYWLARRLQLYLVLQSFAEQVVSSTASGFATVAGVVGIARNVPIVTVVQATLTIIDFTLTKLVLSALPADLAAIDLSVARTTIVLGELTDATIVLDATNRPAPLTLHDVVGMVLLSLGVYDAVTGPPGWVATFADALLNVVNFLVGEMQSRVAAYAASNPDAAVQLDLTLAPLVPQLAWTATAERRDLLDLVSIAPSLVAPEASELEWRANPTTEGTAGIYARPATGAAASLWSLPPGFTYDAGAYGESMVPSQTVQVTVARPLVLQVSFPPGIAPNATAPLEVRVGAPDAAGGTRWIGAAAVELEVTGGTATAPVGYTDATGTFGTGVRPDAGAALVRVLVRAIEPGDGRVAERTVDAVVAAPSVRLFAAGVPGDPYNYLAFAYTFGSPDGEADGAPAAGVPLLTWSGFCDPVGGIDFSAGGQSFSAATSSSSAVTSVASSASGYTVSVSGSAEITGGRTQAVSDLITAGLVLLVDNTTGADMDVTVAWGVGGTASMPGGAPLPGVHYILAYWTAQLSYLLDACNGSYESGDLFTAYEEAGPTGTTSNTANASGSRTFVLPPGRHRLHPRFSVGADTSAPDRSGSATYSGSVTISY